MHYLRIATLLLSVLLIMWATLRYAVPLLFAISTWDVSLKLATIFLSSIVAAVALSWAFKDGV